MAIDKISSADERLRAITYIKILVEVAREPFLALDGNLKVLSANDSFYQTFQVSKEETVGNYVYDLGNGQWNIPELKKLLEGILPQKKVFKDYLVEHEFRSIGRRIMLLNARKLDSLELIILAFEDVTKRKEIERQALEYTKKLEAKVAERTEALANQVKELEAFNQSMVGRELKMVELKKEIENLRKLVKNTTDKKENE